VPKVGVLFEWHASRAAKCLASLLGAGFQGKVQSDGFSAYPAFAKDKPGVELFGCWAHARRGIFQATAEDPRQAGWLLQQIGALFGWEARLREARAGPALRQAVRASHHRMVVERLHRALQRLQPRYLPKSKMGEAIGYVLNQWASLARIVDHGEVEWSNNLVENVIRPTAIGKHYGDFLVMESERGKSWNDGRRHRHQLRVTTGSRGSSSKRRLARISFLWPSALLADPTPAFSG
jgi:hypothetical protein